MNVEETQALAREILEIIQEIPDTAIEKMLSAWGRDEKLDRYNIEEIMGISGQKLGRIITLLEEQKEHVTINAMFAAGLVAKSRYEKESDEVEIVWTGPQKIGTDVRRTEPTINQLLRSAKKKVTIIDYRITVGAEEIIEQLNSCLDDGVEIDLIVDDDRKNRKHIRKCFSEINTVRPRIFYREGEESKMYKVHAKVIVIDDTEMLIGSANLTHHGTEVNFELGVLIRGPIAKEMRNLLEKMIEDKYFVEDKNE